ncbi:MAG: ABC transporter ATP-binding protein [Candidatus Omnitrophota bacterium]
MRAYIRLLEYLRDHKKLFGWALFAMFFASIFEGFQISFLIPITDRIFNKKEIVLPNDLPQPVMNVVDYLNQVDPETLFWTLPFVALGLIIIKHIFIFMYGYLMNDVAQRVVRDVRLKLYEKIQSLSLDFFNKQRTGELISRVTNDVPIIESAVSYAITDLFTQTFLIITYAMIALSIHTQAALVTFLVLPWIIWPVSVIGKRLKKLAHGEQERIADISSTLIETISGIKVIKSFCTQQSEIQKFFRSNYQYYKLKMKSTKRLKVLAPITEVFGVICGLIIIFWLGRQVMQEELSFGVFAVFLGSVLSIVRPIKKLGNVNAIVQRALSANERIQRVLSQEPTVKESGQAVDLDDLREGIVFEHVDFAYGAENEQVLSDIDMTIPKGQLVAIVGPTGSGKSTLVNLIPRFHDPTAGRVLFDGKDLREVTISSLRGQIGIVSQETFLFHDTVRNNIAYGRDDVSEKEVISAAEKAYAHRFIQSMEQGYDTVLGERGVRLSGGERQRISIARAILKNPPILILDEATSALDSESEKYVKEALEELMKGRTVVAIAHRLSTIRQADRIIVLEEGRVTDSGTHDELVARGGLYKRLYQTQFDVVL